MKIFSASVFLKERLLLGYQSNWASQSKPILDCYGYLILRWLTKRENAGEAKLSSIAYDEVLVSLTAISTHHVIKYDHILVDNYG